MDQAEDRVACPACGARFKAPAADVPPGDAGLKARCRRCKQEFRVLNQDGVLSAVSDTPAPAAPASPVKASRRASSPPTKPAPTPFPSAPSTRPAKSEGTTTGAADLPMGAFNEGDRLGRYEIESVLGRGGMGTVYSAYDPAANRQVALKVLLREATELDRMRFRREIEVQGNIQHPNIMPILDSGQVGQQRYYVMELLRDPIDLFHLVEIARSGALERDPKLRPLARIENLIAKIVLPICQAVFHANQNEGVLHRDIKPANVILDRKGLRPLLIDFGVSSILDKKNARLAHLDRELPIPLKGEGIRITGTLVFMPPEQAHGEADRRGDVWALGALLHFICAGEPPLEPVLRGNVPRRQRVEGLQMLIDMARDDGRVEEAREFALKLAEVKAGRERTIEELQKEVLEGRYRPRPPGLDRSLDAIIGRAMAKRPEDRYRHALELHDDLEAWLAARPVQARVKSSTAAGGLWYRLRLLVQRQKIAVFLFVLVIAAAAYFVFRPRDDAPDARLRAAERLDDAKRQEAAGKREAARTLGREALVLDPTNDETFALLERLRRAERVDTDLTRARALRRGARLAFHEGRTRDAIDALAALNEIVRQRLEPEVRSGAFPMLAGEVAKLASFARDEQSLVISGAPAGANFALIAIDGKAGRIQWQGALPLRATDGTLDDVVIRSGYWILEVSAGGGQLYVPFEAPAGGTGVQLACPADPAALPAGMVYVGAGRVRGPLGEVTVRPLLWDRAEVTCARYARFLASLTPEEQRRRVPRLAGILGSPGRPVWESDGDGFKAPAGAVGLPVEAISLYDARAFARFEKRRLPSAAEWAWAASGPDGRLCSVGPVEALAEAGIARVDRAGDGVASVRAATNDRSPFGLFGMAGNVAEYSRTLETVRGATGWLVMGGSYRTGPAKAIITETTPVPGWLPLQGVGFRCVREP